MAKWEKVQITRENGEIVDAQAPIIISASRSTDIPAFYSDWFFHRLKVGYSAWNNPFNNTRSYISYDNTRFIVFWSKNPKPLLNHLDELKERGIGCYIQYTLNDYEKEGLEKGVPALEERIDTFKQLVDKLGEGSVIWRFDPLILTNTIGLHELLEKVENVGDRLKGYTEKVVFSFADIAVYKKVANNLTTNGVQYREWTEDEMEDFARWLSELNQKWGYVLATCGEKVPLEQYGIQHNKCVDDELIRRLTPNDEKLMSFLSSNASKDKGQRMFCGCIMSKDIGEYNTCPHLCEYCYANSNKQTAVWNWKHHQANSFGETITGS